MAVQGKRIAGGFILIIGIEGIWYAVRQKGVGLILDADECGDDSANDRKTRWGRTKA
jgi:hypothetical protein